MRLRSLFDARRDGQLLQMHVLAQLGQRVDHGDLLAKLGAASTSPACTCACGAPDEGAGQVQHQLDKRRRMHHVQRLEILLEAATDHPHIHTSTHPHIHTSTHHPHIIHTSSTHHPHIHTSTHPHIHTSTHRRSKLLYAFFSQPSVGLFCAGHACPPSRLHTALLTPWWKYTME